jgi:hypothetical protein
MPMASCSAAGAGGGLFGGGRGGGAGPLVPPGKYTISVTPTGGPTLRTEVTVEPDPRWSVSDADRKSRQTAITSAYALQQQLAPARETAQKVAEQVAVIRQYLVAAGEGGRGALAPTEKVAAQISQVQGQIARALASAGQAQGAIDGYDGAPTAAQLRQLDWAWEDAMAGVAALDQMIQQDMPSVYAAVGGAVRFPEVRPVAAPARP